MPLLVGLALVAVVASARSQTFQEKFATCQACHGESGQSELPETPSLAGQPSVFVLYQLVFFRGGQRNEQPMAEIMKGASDDDLRAFTRIRLLERRRALLEDRLSTIKDSLRATRERVDDYTLALMEHGRSATESDIAWLEGLIQAERHRNATTPGGTKRRASTLRRKERAS